MKSKKKEGGGWSEAVERAIFEFITTKDHGIGHTRFQHVIIFTPDVTLLRRSRHVIQSSAPAELYLERL